VPNAALRWTPQPGQIAPGLRQKSHEQPSRLEHGSATVWVEDGKFVRPIPVHAGLTDGTSSEVEGEGLTEGLRTIVGESARGVEGTGSGERNPFAPQIFRGQSSGQGQTQGSPGEATPSSDERKGNR